jgi:hypothetical protein
LFLLVGNTIILCTVHGPDKLRLKSTELDLTCHRRVYWKSLNTRQFSRKFQENIFNILKLSLMILEEEERYYEQWFEQFFGSKATSSASTFEDINLLNAEESIFLGNFYPRAGLHVVFQVIEQDGSLLSCAVNAFSLAMLHAGLPLKSTLFAVDIAAACQDHVAPREDAIKLILFPDALQQKNALFNVSFVLQNTFLASADHHLLSITYTSSVNSPSDGRPHPIVGESFLPECLTLAHDTAPALLNNFKTILSGTKK